MSLKVLLINPPFMRLNRALSFGYNLPLGLAYVATHAVKNGFYTRIYDSEVDLNKEKGYLMSEDIFRWQHKVYEAVKDDENPVWNEIRERVGNFEPDVVGVQVMSCKYPMALKVAEIIKEVDPKIKVVMGGHHPTIFPDIVIEEKNVDFIVRGEGEAIFTNLLKMLEAGQSPETVAGISFKQNGKLIHNVDRPYEKDLDRYGYPDRSLVLYQEKWDPAKFSFLMGSRGCPFPCQYCGTSNMWTTKVRYRTVSNVIEEMKMLYDEYSCRIFTFCDDSFTLNKKRTEEFCKAVIDEFDRQVTWSCTTRLDLLDEELIALMKRAGCNGIAVGVESGSERVLKILQKDTSKEKMRVKSRMIKDAGIFFTAFFMIGLPGETKEEMYDTLEFMKELKPGSTHLTLFSPQPNTGLYNMLLESGKVPERDWSVFSQENIDNFFVEGMTKEEYQRVAYDIAGEFHSYAAELYESGLTDADCFLGRYRRASDMKRNGRLKKALESFTELIESGKSEATPFLAGAHYHSGEIHLTLKRYDGAKKEFEKCLKLAPMHKKARESLSKLDAKVFN